MSDEPRPMPEHIDDPQTGISIRFIRSWRPETRAERLEAWRRFRLFIEAHEQLRTQCAYEANQTDDGRAILRSLHIAPM